MLHARLVRLSIALCLLLCLGGGCAGPMGPMQIPLRWAPTSDLHLSADSVAALRQQVIGVPRFVDLRADRRAIGKNTEARVNNTAKDAWLVSTTDDVGAFLSERFQDILRAKGIATVTARATRVIMAEVQSFFVTEGETYRADVILRFIVEDGAGQVLWQGVAEGHANRWGRSYKAENYQEALSDAFLEATQGLLENRDFLQAFRS